MPPNAQGFRVRDFSQLYDTPWQTPSHILSVGHWLNMERVDAGSLPAQMVQFIPRGNCTMDE